MKVYPFHNGYAVCSYFENPQKHQGIVNYLIDKNKSEVTLKYNEKTYKASEVDFISSVNDENIGFVVIKKAVYIFNANNKQCFANNKNNKLKTSGKVGSRPRH